MVDLPKVSRRNVVTTAPETASPGAAAAPFRMLAESFDAVGDKLEVAGLPAQEAAGAKAVTLDASGNPQVEIRPEFSRSDVAYNRGAQTAALAQYSTKINGPDGLLSLRQKYDADPEGFKAAGEQYVQTISGRAPAALQGPVKAAAQSAFEQHYTGIINQKRRLDQARDETTVKTEQTRLTNNLLALSRQGAMNTPEAQKTVEDLRALQGEQVKNPLFAKSQQVADAEMDEITGKATGEALVGTLERSLTKDGVQGAAKTLSVLKEEIRDPKLNLKPSQRQQYDNLLDSTYREARTYQTAQTAELRKSADSLRTRVASGESVPPEEIRELSGQMRASGLSGAALGLERATLFRPFVDRVVDSDGSPAKLDTLAAPSRGGASDVIRYANQGATRSQPLAPKLTQAMSFLKDMGVTAEVFSGGQPTRAEGGPRTGSERHDHGGAGDMLFYKDGRKLDWANEEDRPIFQEIVRRGRAAGLTGFGAGPGYMQAGSMHVGFGHEGVWGAGGSGAAAPMWLRQAYGDPRSGRATGNPVDIVVNSIVGAESGGDANARNPKSSAAGLGQFTKDTWLSTVKTYRPDLLAGRSEAQLLALRSDPTIAREMTRAHTVENGKELTGAGYDATPGNLYLMHFAGKNGGLSILRSDDSKPIEQVLGADAISANGFLRGKTVGDVKAWAASKMQGGGASSQGPTRAAAARATLDGLPIAEARRIVLDLTTQGGKELDEIASNIGKGLPPDETTVRNMQDIVAVTGSPELARRAQEIATSSEAFAAIDAAGPMRSGELVAAIEAKAGADGYDHAEALLVDGVRQRREANQKRFEASPIDAARLPGGPLAMQGVAGVDWTNAQTMAPGLALRSKQAQQVGVGWNTGPISALMPGEAANLGRVLESGTADQQSAVLGSLAANLSPEIYKATMAEVFKKSEDKVAVIAGALYQTNPETSQSILRGRTLLAAEPKYKPKSEDLQVALVGSNPKLGAGDAIFPVSVLPVAMRGQWPNMVDAATAVYADRLNRRGILPADLDQDAFKSAVNAVTGGVLEYNGSKVLAPKTDMSQIDFDKITGAITDADLKGAVTKNGRAVDAKTFHGSFLGGEGARLQSVADGRYYLYFGSVGEPQYILGDGGKPFVLDMRGR